MNTCSKKIAPVHELKTGYAQIVLKGVLVSSWHVSKGVYLPSQMQDGIDSFPVSLPVLFSHDYDFNYMQNI